MALAPADFAVAVVRHVAINQLWQRVARSEQTIVGQFRQVDLPMLDETLPKDTQIPLTLVVQDLPRGNA